jgi:hypothetical protein
MKPYHFEIQDDGSWKYFVAGQEVEIYEYRRAVAALEHERKQEADRTRGEQAKGVYIGWSSPDGVRHPQLAKTIWDNSPGSKFYSFKDLDRKAAAMGMVGNRTAD